jgi:TetR/AcrR family transcriptional regulator, ethionamide resistance regulator
MLAGASRYSHHMPLPGQEAVGRRRRRTPEAAQREIIAAAEDLLRERPFREMTVDEVMRRTGLSRPSFYVYFKDRHELLLRLVQHLAAELLVVANRWYEAANAGPEELMDALNGVVSVYGEHGSVMRALADAAVDDDDVETAYDALIHGFVQATATHIGRGIDAKEILPLDPHETAKALVWMGERYLYHCFGPERQVAREKVVETLRTVWVRTLYGPQDARAAR